jgi:hypothetical protein
MSKKFIITENEKNEIKQLYNLKENVGTEYGAGLLAQQIIDDLKKRLSNSFIDKDESKTDSTDTKNDNQIKSNLLGKSNPNMSNFKDVTKKVVEKLEGGYYNPEWHYKSAMGRSGETMFGIDRRHGGKLNTSPAGQKFWSIIDQNKNKSTWKHGYDGGPYREELLNLVSDIMKPQYESNASRYLSPESIKIINGDPRLLFHFIYASWNGSGWFKKFATKFNEEVKKGVISPDKLVDVAIDSRTNSGNNLIARGGKKIESFIQNIA